MNSLIFPDRTEYIKYHRDNARKYVYENKHDLARIAFNKWIESIRQQNIMEKGVREKELADAKNEFSQFVKTDPLFTSICEVVLPKIQNQPGIEQAGLYLLCSQFSKGDISYALYFAAEHGKIKRIKAGKTYSLYII